MRLALYMKFVVVAFEAQAAAECRLKIRQPLPHRTLNSAFLEPVQQHEPS